MNISNYLFSVVLCNAYITPSEPHSILFYPLIILACCTTIAMLLYRERSKAKTRVLEKQRVQNVELKKMIRTSIENEVQHTLLFENAQDAIVVLDDGYFSDCNPKTIEIFQLTREELLTKSPIDLSPEYQPDGQPSKEASLHYIQLALEGKPQIFEWQHMRRDGEVFDCSISLHTVTIHNKQYIQAVIRELTELKATKKELLETKSILETAIAQSPAGILIADAPDVKIRLANNAAFNISGEDPKILTNIDVEQHSINWQTLKPDGSIFPPKELPLSKAVLQGITTYQEELIIRDIDGVDHWVSANASPILDANNEIIAGIVIFHDITQNILAKQALEESEKKFRTLAENIPGTIYLCQNNERFSTIYLNEQIEHLTGYSTQEFLDDKISFSDLFHPEDRGEVYELVDAAVNNKEGFQLSYRFKHLSGEWRWAEEHGIGIYKEGELIYLEGFIIDVTDKKNNESELKQHQENLEELVKEKTNNLETTNKVLKSINEELKHKNDVINETNDELNSAIEHLRNTQAQLLHAEKMASLGILTAGVAHEINNPLNFIQGGYIGLENHFKANGETDETVLYLMSGIKTGVERATKIVKSLGQFSRDNEKYDEVCDLKSIIDNCILILNNQFKHRVDISIKYPEEDVIIQGNVGKLHQVFVNLLSNANQSIDKSGEIKINIKIIDASIIIEIKDDGQGISKKNLTKITDPFFTTKEPGIGTGLGLSISYSILKNHSGSFNFESVEDKGTTVTVTLPLS